MAWSAWPAALSVHAIGSHCVSQRMGTQADVAKLTIYLVEGVDVNEAFTASRAVWGDQPTAVTGVFVKGLARPELLVEIEAIAAVTH